MNDASGGHPEPMNCSMNPNWLSDRYLQADKTALQQELDKLQQELAKAKADHETVAVSLIQPDQHPKPLSAWVAIVPKQLVQSPSASLILHFLAAAFSQTHDKSCSRSAAASL